jgi:hypothetical protein
MPQALMYLHTVKKRNVMLLRTNEKASKETDTEMNSEIPQEYKEWHGFLFLEDLSTIMMPNLECDHY